MVDKSEENPAPPKLRRGFAVMSPEQHRPIAVLGGKTAHSKKVAHRFSPDLAREAGSKGGQKVSADRDHMARIGRIGGKRRAEGASMTYAGIKYEDGWPESAKEFGPTLRAVRELVGISRVKLAERAGVSWATLRNIEEGYHATAPNKRASLIAVLSSVEQPEAPSRPTALSEKEGRSLRVLGPYPYRDGWRLVLCLDSERIPRSYDTREQAETERARLRLSHSEATP